MNAARHPLDPLTADEISHAVAIVRKTRALADDVLFVRVSLHEPPKEIVLGLREGEPVDRQAFVILRDRRARATIEAVVSLGRGVVVSWRDVSGVQPPITFEEFFACERLVRSNSAWLDAVRKRGVADPELAIVDPWSAGHYGAADDPPAARGPAAQACSLPHRRRSRSADERLERAGPGMTPAGCW